MTTAIIICLNAYHWNNMKHPRVSLITVLTTALYLLAQSTQVVLALEQECLPYQCQAAVSDTPQSLPLTAELSPDGSSIAGAYSSYLNSEAKGFVERSVLSALGIDAAPSSLENANNSGSLYVHNLYKKFNRDGRFFVNPKEAHIPVAIIDSDGATYSIPEQLRVATQRAINESDTIISCIRRDSSGANRMVFNLSPSIKNLISPRTPVLSAELRIFRDLKQAEVHEDISLIAARRKLHETISVDAKHHGWLTINATNIVTDWAQTRSQMDPGELHIDLVAGHVKALITSHGILNSPDVPKELQPFLVVYLITKDLPKSNILDSTGIEELALQRYLDELRQIDTSSPERRKRALKQKNHERTFKNESVNLVRNAYHHKFCHRVAWLVNFKDLKWSDWIIAPDSYEANYCLGECPFPLHPNLNSSNHAIIQMLAHLMDQATPKPCCAPIQLHPITVLYYDDYSNVVLKEYRKMIVHTCGCI